MNDIRDWVGRRHWRDARDDAEECQQEKLDGYDTLHDAADAF